MLRIHVPDYRRSSEAELLDGLARRDPLALAEAYHRTVPAANACARRLLGTPAESEALLQTVYHELWASPPAQESLESWVRARCFSLAADHLRAVGRGPASPSAHALLPDLPGPPERSHDPVEDLLAGLDERDRKILLAAHDQGVSTAHADDPRAAAAVLDRALLTLAGPDAEAEASAAGEQATRLPLGDWVLGLLQPEAADRVQQEVSAHEATRNRARLLRRGRRRLEGLPPTPDMGQRIVAAVLTGLAAEPSPEAAPAPAADDDFVSALDTELHDEEAAAEPVAPDRETDEPEHDEATTSVDETAPEPEAGEDEAWLWDAEEEAPREKRRWGRRVLAFLAWLLLVGAGIVGGMYVGSLLAGP